jgi:glycerophosphoryl diester phosphodiesterase
MRARSPDIIGCLVGQTNPRVAASTAIECGIDMLHTDFDPSDEGQENLCEILQAIQARVPLSIEIIKRHSACHLFEILQKYIWEDNWEEDQFLISAAKNEQWDLRSIREMMPRVPIGIIHQSAMPPGPLCNMLDAHCIITPRHLTYDYTSEYIHDHGMRHFVYTINDEDEFPRYERYGVDGIFTHLPTA